MDNLLDLLFQQDTVENLAKQVNVDPTQVAKLTELSVPTMLKALQNNASTQQGKDSLEEALTQHQVGNNFDLGSLLQGRGDEDNDKIVHHMFGGQTQQVTNKLAKESGLDVGVVFELIKKYAPMVLAALSFKKMAGGLGDVFGGLLGGNDNQPAKPAKNNNDLGDIIGDLLGQTTKKSNNNDLLGGLGDILGGFLK